MCRRVFLLIVVVLLMAGCRGRDTLAPTPFPTTGPTPTTAAGGPVVLSVTELLAAPGLYLDTVVQLTGHLRKMPLVVCDSDYYAPPANWGLGEEGLTAAAGGFDEQVRSLLPGDLTMIVEGRWRRWEGTVGCGKQAQRQEVWYLDVGRILSPSPLTQVTLTPSSGVEVSAITAEVTLPVGGGDDEGEIAETPELEETPVAVEPTEFPQSYPGAATPSPEESPEFSPTIPTDQTPITAQTPITGSTPIAGETVTGTLPSGTTTPTAGSGTPGASGNLVDKGNIYEAIADNFTTSLLAAGTVDRWELALTEDADLYFSAIAPQPADIVLSLFKDGQAVISNQNTAPAGAPEILNAPPLQGTGMVEIHVAVSGGGATEYGLTIHQNAEFPVTIGGIITPGSPQNGVQLPMRAVHMWFFMAGENDVVAIRLKPVSDLDAAADLYGPGAIYIDTIDTGFEGEEEYQEVTLSTAGLHAIRVFEYYAVDPMTYDLEISYP